ncbi:MAG: hypothetical protein Q8N03_02225 [Ignavibacteria bacterium]|nr:hypothetical protein [Ignavibacteria bacterium]
MLIKQLTNLIIFTLLSIVHLNGQIDAKLVQQPHSPQWIKVGDKYSDQTSGICFIEAKRDQRIFLLADDTGAIHRMVYKNNKIVELTTYSYSKKAKKYLEGFSKKDFEEIAFDRSTGDVYLSIEGNEPFPKSTTKIVKVKFKNNSIYQNSIIDFEELKIQPQDLFEKYLENNVAYEGLAVDNNYIYLGLEGFQTNGFFFSDSTLIHIVDKKSLNIIKTISTKKFGIGTICGLHKQDNLLWGVDRNGFNIFSLKFDENLDIIDWKLFPFQSKIPNTINMSYIAAIESITIDDEENAYIIDDPWKRFYIPSEEIQKKLNDSEVANFKKFIPIIYNYKIKRNN